MKYSFAATNLCLLFTIDHADKIFSVHRPRPFQIDFNKPETCNIKGTRNFYLESKENVLIGVWWDEQTLFFSLVPFWSFSYSSFQKYYECLMISTLCRHILPSSSIRVPNNSSESFDESLRNGKPIIVYVHGNSGDRGSGHRVDLYKRLQEHDYHIIAFDYRSK